MNRYKKRAVFDAIFTDKGFYAILAASIIMVGLAAYLALGSKDNDPEKEVRQNSINSTNLSSDEILEDGYVPDWPDEEGYSTVENSESGITDVKTQENENNDTEKEPVKLQAPISDEFIVFVNEFSGTEPVFSDSLNDWRIHNGTDYITETEVDVTAAADGIVEDVYEDGLMGMSVLLLHADGVRTLYQSLNLNPEVVKGMSVTSGQIIGKTGNSAASECLLGTHLHYSIIKDGEFVEP